MNGDAFLSVEEVAERLGVPISWVYNQAHAGKIPAHKIGKYVRVDPTELRQWLGEQRHGKRREARA